MKINFSKPDIIEYDLFNVQKSIKSGWLTHGKFSDKFEKLFTNFTKAKYATTVSNCTAALHLSCIAAGFKNNDEVIVPAQTHTATAHAIEYTGAKPIFVDVDELSGNILYEKIESKITSNTKGIIIVHMAGMPCNMVFINKLCKKYKLKLIEDCAHALGSKFNNKHVGNFGITGCFSFYPTKQITSGEGGIVISNNLKIINKIRTLKAFGINTPPNNRFIPGKYDVMELGLNYRMTDFQAALAYGQLQRYKKNLLKRKQNALIYEKYFSLNNDIKFLKYNENHSYFLFQIFVKNFIYRDRIILKLKEMNIGASIHYATPVPFLTYYKKKYKPIRKEFKNSLVYANSNISLPVHPGISKSQIIRICKVIKKLLVIKI